MATIVSENRKQIRDPMIVQFDMDISEDSRINTYTPTTSYKSWDNTLGNVWPMRVLADLQDEGFLLDGTAEWYEEKTASAEAGKLGLRSNEGEPVSIRLVGNKTIKNLTIGTQGVGNITYGSTVIQATGRDFINVNAQTINLTFTPTIEHGRMMVEFIFPGMDLEIRNDNLLKANVNLRCNLDPFATTLEASEIEIEMYYPNDIGDAFKYIGDDWPITYRAGYSDQMSPERKFYLSDQVTWKDGVLTIHGVDAVPKLEETIKEGNLGMTGLNMLHNPAAAVANWRDLIEDKTPVRMPSFLYYEIIQYSDEYVVRKECSLRDVLQRVMSLTESLPKNCRLWYVDAGIPTLSVREMLGQTWTIDEEDMAGISVTKLQNISKIQSPSEDELYDERLYGSKTGPWVVAGEPFEVEAGQMVSTDHNGGYAIYTTMTNRNTFNGIRFVSFTPSEATFQARENSNNVVAEFIPLKVSGGVRAYTNANGMPGSVEEYDHIMHGRAFSDPEATGININLFTPKNLFNVSRDTIEFDYKGDPRWQPHDLLNINRLDGTTLRVRLSSIEITHEGGGTMAHVVAKYLSPQELQN